MPEPRYGVFLRPEPEMCRAVTTITRSLRAQFGLVSAAAFPPHVTIVGSLHTAEPVERLVSAIDDAIRDQRPVVLVNGGLRTPDPGIPIDVHTDGHGSPNAHLLEVAQSIFDHVLPLSVPGDTRLSPRTGVDFWAHLSLASHDLALRPDLYREVRAFVDGLPIAIPARSLADTVSLFEFRTADDWTESPWWETLTWRHLRSWTLH